MHSPVSVTGQFAHGQFTHIYYFFVKIYLIKKPNLTYFHNLNYLNIMYCIFWPLTDIFVNFYEKAILMGELSVGQIVRWANCPWANCPLGKLSMGGLSVGELSVARIVRRRIVRSRPVSQHLAPICNEKKCTNFKNF